MVKTMKERNQEEIVASIEVIARESRKKIEETVKKFFPEEVDQKKIEYICGKPNYEYDLDAINNGIQKPGWELLRRGGKKWRPMLMMFVIESLGKNPKDFLDFLIIPEVIHSGTLIIDDIEDNSMLRRGERTIHTIFGIDISINAGNTMYYVPLLSLIKNKKSFSPKLLMEIYEIYAQEMINISYGQGTDIYWHKGKKRDVTVNQYLQMAAYKTGTLARMSAKVGAKLCGANDKVVEAFGYFAESIAIAFQIQDDILNLQEKVGKEFGEDIKEGKQSLLVIRALQKLPTGDANRLIQILNLHTDDIGLIKEAIELIESTDAIDFAKEKAKNLVENSWTKLENLIPDNEGKKKLKLLADYLIMRSN